MPKDTVKEVKKDYTEPPPWLPPRYKAADITAVQAVAGGTADEDQQIRAMKWIMYSGSGMDDFEYRQDDRDHAFASGRRFVGLQIRKLLSLNPQAFIKKQGE